MNWMFGTGTTKSGRALPRIGLLAVLAAVLGLVFSTGLASAGGSHTTWNGPNLHLEISPSGAGVPSSGGQVQFTLVTSTAQIFFDSCVDSVTGGPSGTTFAVNPPGCYDGTRTLTATVPSGAATGTFQFTVNGSTGVSFAGPEYGHVHANITVQADPHALLDAAVSSRATPGDVNAARDSVNGNTNARASDVNANTNARANDVNINTNNRAADVNANTNNRAADVNANTDARAGDINANMNAARDNINANTDARTGDINANTNVARDNINANTNARASDVNANTDARANDVNINTNNRAADINANTDARANDVNINTNNRAADINANTDARANDVNINTNNRAADINANTNARANDVNINTNNRAADINANTNARAADINANTNARADAIDLALSSLSGQLAAHDADLKALINARADALDLALSNLSGQVATHDADLNARADAIDLELSNLSSQLNTHDVDIKALINNRANAIDQALADHAAVTASNNANITAVAEVVLDHEKIELEVVRVKDGTRYLLQATEAGRSVDVTLESVRALTAKSNKAVDIDNVSFSVTVVDTGILDVTLTIPGGAKDSNLLEFVVEDEHVNPVLGTVNHSGTALVNRNGNDQ